MHILCSTCRAAIFQAQTYKFPKPVSSNYRLLKRSGPEQPVEIAKAIDQTTGPS